jgi:hypothetical protein
MNRRDFVAGSLGASMVPAIGQSPASATGTEGVPTATARPQVYELRRVHLRNGAMVARYHEYAKTAWLPAVNRAGIRPVGAFTVSVGPDAPTVYLLIPHPNAESVLTLSSRMNDDAEYQKAGAAFRALPAGDPPYIRRESSLMTAFPGAPTLDPPSGPNAAPTRLFELRTYESHNDRAHLNKVEMFEKGGEFPIFRRSGLTPVFFGRNLVGAGLPSLTYMLVFPHAAAFETSWQRFREDPEWLKLRARPEYADNVSNIHNVLLRPTDYSQI